MIHRLVLLLLFATAAHAFVSPMAIRRKVLPRLFAASSSNTEDEPIENTDSSLMGRGSRRNVLQSALLATVGAGTANAATSTATTGLLADLPMIRLKIPGSGLGKDYVAVQVCLPGQENKPVEFMLDTGLTLELVTPHLKSQLGLKSQKSGLTALAAGGVNAGAADLVTVTGASICDPASQQLVPLSDMHASVQDFPQEHIDPKHDPVEGMLGQEILSQYDVDLDFPAGRVRLYKPGTAAASAAKGLVEIPAIVINETGLLGFRLRSGENQPILAFIDCGSTFSAVNWKAAAFLGLPTNRNDPAYRKGPGIMAVGIDGRPLQLPTIQKSLTFAGEAKTDNQGQLAGFESAPSNWKPWKPVFLAVGDLPVFPQVLGDGVHPYTGPAALIGLDVLAQRRVIIESAGQARTRRRRLFVSPS